MCSLAGRYDKPIPTRFLAPIDCLKIPACSFECGVLALRRSLQLFIRCTWHHTLLFFNVPGTVKAGNFVNGVLFRHHSVKTLGASAWLSLTATDFVQKQSRHDVIFSFEVDSYKI